MVVEGKGRASIGSGESGSEKKTTVIGRINTRTGEFTPVTRTYDLKGRSLNVKPKAKGVYVEKNALKNMDLQQKKQYTTPEMKVEVLKPRCNLLEASLPSEIGVIINENN